MSDFDYGEPKADGQYQRYPSSVRVKPDGAPDFVQPIRNKYRHLKCGAVTLMRGDDLCLTYATNPHFYGATFCVGCHAHLPLAQFVWEPDNVPMSEVAGEPGKDLRR
jgi:hypothetical protein